MPDIIITPSSGLIDFFPVSTRVGRIEGSGNTINVLNPSGYVAVSGSGMSINTSSPNALLHAYSSISGATILNLEGTNGSLFSVVDNLSGSLMSVNNNAGLPVFEVFSDDRIIGGRFGQNDFVMTSGGNIGIGTGVPSSKFHVVGTSTFGGDISSTGSVIVGSGTAANPAIEFVGDIDTGIFTPAGNILGISTSGVERMRITQIGNVGINTTTPSGHLDVAGDVYIRGTGNNLGTAYFKSQSVGDRTLYLGATNGGDLVLNGGGANIQLSSQGGYLNVLGFSTQLHIGHGYDGANTTQLIRFLPAAREMMRMTTSGTIGIGLPTSSASYAGNTVQLFNQQPYINTRVHIAGSGSTSTSAALVVTNSGIDPILYVRNDRAVGINTNTPSGQLHVVGSGIFTSGLYIANNTFLNGSTSNRIEFNTNGANTPTTTTRSAGTKIVLYPLVSSTSVDYAIGIENGGLWNSVPDSSSFFRWYASTAQVASLDGNGNFSSFGLYSSNIRQTVIYYDLSSMTYYDAYINLSYGGNYSNNNDSYMNEYTTIVFQTISAGLGSNMNIYSLPTLYEGAIKIFHNLDTIQDVIFQHEYYGGNDGEIATSNGYDFVLGPGASCMMQYLGSRWRMISCGCPGNALIS